MQGFRLQDFGLKSNSRTHRRRMAESLRSVIQTHLGLIESLEQSVEPVADHKLASLALDPDSDREAS